MLQRWFALDAALGSPEGVIVATFAKGFAVSVGTIYRDLKALAEMGYASVSSWPSASPRVRWNYATSNPTPFLFAANCGPRGG